jgi:hypothetical protein
MMDPISTSRRSRQRWCAARRGPALPSPRTPPRWHPALFDLGRNGAGCHLDRAVMVATHPFRGEAPFPRSRTGSTGRVGRDGVRQPVRRGAAAGIGPRSSTTIRQHPQSDPETRRTSDQASAMPPGMHGHGRHAPVLRPRTHFPLPLPIDARRRDSPAGSGCASRDGVRRRTRRTAVDATARHLACEARRALQLVRQRDLLDGR